MHQLNLLAQFMQSYTYLLLLSTCFSHVLTVCARKKSFNGCRFCSSSHASNKRIRIFTLLYHISIQKLLFSQQKIYQLNYSYSILRRSIENLISNNYFLIIILHFS